MIKNNTICYLGSSFTRKDSRIVYRQAISMHNAGYDVFYVLSDELENFEKFGINFISTGRKFKNRLFRMLFNKNDLYKIAKNIDADVYQISEPELIRLGLKIKKRLNKKIIFDMREDYPELILKKTYIPQIIRPIISKYITFLMRQSLKKYDMQISVTPNLVEFLKVQCKCKNTIMVTNYPILSDKKNMSYEEYLQRNNSLLYIGTIYRISRQELLLNLLGEMKDIEYVIAGRFYGKYRNELEMHKNWHKVKFIDGFKRENMNNIMSMATIGNSLRDFSQTGTKEGSLGVLKLFEYMEAGLPVICSDVPLWREIIDKYKCGICVDPNDEKKIGIAVKYLMDNKSEAYNMGQNGRRAVLEKYNWSTQFKIYNNKISKIIT